MLALTEDCPLETLESDHDHCHVVEGLTVEGVLEHTLHGQATLLVHVLSCSLIPLFVVEKVKLTRVPDTSIHISI